MESLKFADGGCTCGGVRFHLTQAPLFVHCCHCTWCQRETGSAFVLNAMIETASVVLDKDSPVMIDTPSESGNGQVIARCPDCQVALWSHYSGLGEKIAFIRVGTLDDPSVAPPDIHIFTRSKQSWLTLPEGARVRERYYDWRKEWPDAAQARRRAMKR